MASTPLDIFNAAHKRADIFLNERSPKKKKFDDLRAAVIFEVAAIDAYFKVKVINVLRGQIKGRGFVIPESVRNLAKEAAASSGYNGKGYKQLKKEEKRLVDLACSSNESEIVDYVQAAFNKLSFQSISSIDTALAMMGKKPSEIWPKIATQRKLKSKKDNLRTKAGRKIQATVQLKALFSRRHRIVHEADIVLWGKKKQGQQRQIVIEDVRKWLKSSNETIRAINRLVP